MKQNKEQLKSHIDPKEEDHWEELRKDGMKGSLSHEIQKKKNI